MPFFFFSELCPFYDLDILSSIKHPTAEGWHWHAVLLFILKLLQAIDPFAKIILFFSCLT